MTDRPPAASRTLPPVRPSNGRWAVATLAALALLASAPAPATASPATPTPTHAFDRASDVVQVSERRGRASRRRGARRHAHDGGYRRGGWERDHEFRRGRRHAGRCRPGRAVRKAWRLGVDEPRIRRVGRRGVVIAGFRGRSRVVVRFGHARHCPVLAVRRRF